MITYANIALTLEDAEGAVARWLGQHLSLEDLRLFGADTVAMAGGRANSQGGNSHVISLPRPNYPTPPKLRINSLYWPTGAARFAWFLALVPDGKLQQLRSACIGTDRTLTPDQLVIGDGSHALSNGTIPENGFTGDVNYRQLLSTEMWMLPPRCISGRKLFSPSASTPDPYERAWLVPFVDERYFWQTKPTPSYLYGNFFVSETSVPDATLTPPTTIREWRIEFVGQYSRRAMPALTIDGTLLTPGTATASIPTTGVTTGDATTNAAQRVMVDGATCGTFTLSVTIPSSMATLSGIGAITQTTAPIAWDATPEEIESALHDLLLGRVRWQSLIENVSTAIDKRIAYDVPNDGWGWPDRVELDRRLESVGLVLDAIAHSTGRRFVRDIDGTLALVTAADSDTQFDTQTAVTGSWSLICGQETLSDMAWPNNGQPNNGEGVPESIDVVFRDLTRSTRSGSWLATGGSKPNNYWRTDGGRLTVNVNAETATSSQFSDLDTQDYLKVPGWVETIHTPSLNNTGTVPSAGDGYSTLAGFIAADWYDWRRRLFDLRYVGVMPWRMTGFDDHVEFSLGERIGDPTKDEHDSPDGYGGYLASTRIQSMPMNFGCSDSLNQIGTLCGWTEDAIQGEVREALDPALHPRLSASRVRAWAWLPAMELQGETAGLLSTHKRAVTITLRSIDATADPGTYFQAVKFFCENSVNWLDCTRYCGTAEWTWNSPPSLPGGAWTPDDECGAACEAVEPADDGTEDGDTATTNCVDDGSMTLD